MDTVRLIMEKFGFADSLYAGVLIHGFSFLLHIIE